MDNTDPDFDIDPAIAAAMGFSGFGNTKQKRKFDANDGFIDPNVNAAAHANNTMLPSREAKTAKFDGANSAPAEKDRQDSQQKREHVVAELYDPKTQESPSLELLRQGVRNTNGDMVYFLPAFIEDPWEGLKAQ